MTVTVRADGTRVLRFSYQVKPEGGGEAHTAHVDMIVDDSEAGLLSIGSDTIIDILDQQNVGLHHWREIATEYKRAGKVEDCEAVFNAALKKIEDQRTGYDKPSEVTALLAGLARRRREARPRC